MAFVSRKDDFSEQRVTEIIEEFNRDIKNQRFEQWREARKRELANKVKEKFAGKHAKIRFPELDTTLAAQLTVLYRDARLNDETAKQYLDAIRASKGEVRLEYIDRFNNRLKEILQAELVDKPKLKGEYDFIVGHYEAAKGSIMVEWHAAYDAKKNNTERQERERKSKDKIGSGTLGKHSKTYIALLKAERESTEKAKAARERAEAERLAKEEEDRKITARQAVDLENIKKHLVAVDKLIAFNKTMVRRYIDDDITNPERTKRHVAEIADSLAKELTSGGAKRFKWNLKVTKEYFDLVREIVTYKQRIEKALADNNIELAKVLGEQLVKVSTRKLEKFAQGEDGKKKVELACAMAGKMQAVNIADRMLLGKKIGKKEYQPHILFNPLDGVPEEDIEAFRDYTRDFERNKERPLKRAWWYLRTKLGLSDKLLDLQDYLVEHSTLGRECFLGYDYRRKKYAEFAPAVDIDMAEHVFAIANAHTMSREEIRDIIEKRERFEKDRSRTRKSGERER